MLTRIRLLVAVTFRSPGDRRGGALYEKFVDLPLAGTPAPGCVSLLDGYIQESDFLYRKFGKQNLTVVQVIYTIDKPPTWLCVIYRHKDLESQFDDEEVSYIMTGWTRLKYHLCKSCGDRCDALKESTLVFA